jgi:hypothetical protein
LVLDNLYVSGCPTLRTEAVEDVAMDAVMKKMTKAAEMV